MIFVLNAGFNVIFQLTATSQTFEIEKRFTHFQTLTINRNNNGHHLQFVIKTHVNCSFK